MAYIFLRSSKGRDASGLRKILCTLALALLPAALTAAPTPGNPIPVRFQVSTDPSRPRPGEVAQIIAKATIAPGWHLYSIVQTPPPGPTPTKITVSAAPGVIEEVGPVSESKAISALDPNFGKTVAYHAGSAVFTIPVRIARNAENTAWNLSITVDYQVCNDRVCLPPSSVTLSDEIERGQGPVRPQYSVMTVAQTAGAGARSNLLMFLAAAFIAGLLALLTPCVFPLIPVTFGFFTKQIGGNRRRLIGLAGAYALGIIVSFTLLGLVAALTFGAAGANRVAANPWFNLFFGVLFVVFAFSFFESFLITLPPALSRLARPISGASGLTGVLFMGLAFVFAAFTCTAPFIGTILVAAASASGAQWIRPLLGMFVFALALALPFFLLALFPGLLSKLPRSGSWMARFKATLGFVELAYALTYFSKADLVWQARILTGPVILAVWALLAIAAGLYLLGLLRVSAFAEQSARPSRARVAASAIFFAAGIYCLYALTGRPVSGLLLAYLPPTGYGQDAPSASQGLDAGQTWLSNYPQALALAKATGKPIFIDFTGYTCTNCRYVEQNIFPRPPVNALLADRVTRLRLYTDGGKDGPANQAMQQAMFGTVALPMYAIVSSTGRVVSQLSGSGHSVAAFAGFITQGLQAAKPVSPETAAAAAQWGPYSDANIEADARAGRPVIIDFTASWCTNCHALERTVFTAPEIEAKLGRFATYRADLTDFYAAKNAAMEKRYGILQLPAVLFIDANGKETPETRVTGLVTARDFAARMEKSLGSSTNPST